MKKSIATTTAVSSQPIEVDPQSFLAKPYRRVLTPEESGGFTATIHEFPGLVAEGDTAEQALVNLEGAASSWIEAATQSGYPIADPVDFGGCSGKIALRLTRSLHRVVAERADLEGTSINQLLNVAIATYLGQARGLQEAYTQLHELAAQIHTHFRVLSASSSADYVLADGMTSVTSNTPHAVTASPAYAGLTNG